MFVQQWCRLARQVLLCSLHIYHSDVQAATTSVNNCPDMLRDVIVTLSLSNELKSLQQYYCGF